MESGVQHIKTADIDGVLIDEYIGLSLKYAKIYQQTPKAFISSFSKFSSVKMCCSWIVWAYKKDGIFQDCTGDFSEWANKQPVEEKWKRVLAEILKIIHSIVKQ